MSMRSIAHGYNSVLFANFRRRTTTTAFIAMRFDGPSRYCELALTGLLAILVFRARSQDPDMKRCNIVRGDGKGRGVFNLLHYRDSQARTVQVNERLLFTGTLIAIVTWFPVPLTFDSHCSEGKLHGGGLLFLIQIDTTPAPSVYAFQA
ncbi:hypothetical protein EV368DRAFT_60922 [Lentinula lateritia]|nr:hypothetical protein EV368DRAFT_60922 [Lentinula lateritia]